jgi:hypothetical protein
MAAVLVWVAVAAPGATAASTRGSIVVRIERAGFGRPVPAGFVGFSFEYGSVFPYTGTNPDAVNPVLVRLIHNLVPGRGFVLRIGGDSTDSTWWPVPGLQSPRWLAVVRRLAEATRARLILGINLEADNTRIAVAEARALVAGLRRKRIEALELGNEPERYADPAQARPPGYDFQAFMGEFARFESLLPRLPLAGPATGSLSWLSHLSGFLASEPRLAQVTYHRYPLNRCVSDLSSPVYPTVPNLLSPLASQTLTAGIGRYAAIAHQHGSAFRLDELNSVTCQGKLGVSDTFASALWVLDTLFRMASLGVDAVNIHTWAGAPPNELFTFRRLHRRWLGTVRPEYYGLLMFTEAAPPGSRLLKIQTAGGRQVRAWATLAPDHRIRVVLINDSDKQARSLLIRPPVAAGPAALERLRAPSLYATGAVTLAGQSFGTKTASGAAKGPVSTSSVRPVAGRFKVSLPAASAALLIIPGP